MLARKAILGAAALALGLGLSVPAALAQPSAYRDHHAQAVHKIVRHAVRHDVRRALRHDGRHGVHRRLVDRNRVFTTLRRHHYRWLGDPYFLRGHYVVRVRGRHGAPLFVEIDPYTGAFIGLFRD